MACPKPKQEWTIETLIDGRPESETEMLVFCINVENGIIKGEVSDLTSGNAVTLSPVIGISQTLPELDQGFPDPPTLMTLNFTRGTSKVVLWGNTFRVGTQNKFRGRFSALNTPAVNGGSAPVVASETMSSDSDTGTGTGTQT